MDGCEKMVWRSPGRIKMEHEGINLMQQAQAPAIKRRTWTAGATDLLAGCLWTQFIQGNGLVCPVTMGMGTGGRVAAVGSIGGGRVVGISAWVAACATSTRRAWVQWFSGSMFGDWMGSGPVSLEPGSSQPGHAGYNLVNIQGAHSGGYDIETFECWNLASATPLLETQVLEF